MKKVFSLLLVMCLAVGLLAGCGGNGEKSDSDGNDSPSNNSSASSDHRIALITDTVGVNPFLTQCIEAIEGLSGELGYSYDTMECVDASAWEENVNAAVQDGYTMIIGVGWQAAEYVDNAASQYPDKAQYAVIDTIVDNDNVTSIDFKEVEGAYIMGVLAATAFPDSNLFGSICAFQTQAIYEYRWGYMQGVLSVNPDAEFMVNYTDSYTDTSAPYEYALQQQAAGCAFIYGCAGAGNAGIYQAALELGEAGTPIYTNGQDVDETTEENPYILSSQLKNTGNVTADIIRSYMEGTLSGGIQSLGIADKAIDVVNGTTDDSNYLNSDIITDEVVEACKSAYDAIINGEVDLEVPEESDSE